MKDFFEKAKTSEEEEEIMPLARTLQKRLSHGTFTNQENATSCVIDPPINHAFKNDDDQSSVKEFTDNTGKIKFQRQHSNIKPTRHRLVEKNGKRNVRSKYFPRDRYIQDIFTTVIDAKWLWMFVLFVVSYLGSWLFFGVIWWLILTFHGPQCFDDVKSFRDAFLLSLETSMTIGYGGRQVTSECVETVFILIIQSLLSCLIEACIIGLIFTKIARPGKRQSTIIFSHNAVITKRDDKLCFMFNIADVRKRQLVECHVRMHLFRTYKTLEGKVIQNHQDQLRIGMDWYNIRDDSDRLFLLFPCSAVHVIDRKSPFYHMSKDDFLRSDWEVVIILEGVVEATGCVLQTRTSYLPDEVVWGADFTDMATSADWIEDEGMLYQLEKMSLTEANETVPECSAYTYYTRIKKDPDPNDVYGEQDELWDDEQFIPPSEEEEQGGRVLPSHKNITKSSNNSLANFGGDLKTDKDNNPLA